MISKNSQMPNYQQEGYASSVRWTTKTQDARPGSGQDRVLMRPRGDHTLMAVVDGAGGVAGGRAAAEIVCNKLDQADQDKTYDWIACLEDIDHSLVGTGQAAALVAVIGNDGSVRGASVGDCEAWSFGSDHILELTASQVRKPLLGDGSAVPIGFEGNIERVLLAATDGLWKYAKRQHVAELVRAPPIEKASEALVDGIRLKSGSLQDDVAIAIIEYHG